jgi:putative phosphoesterase
MDVAILADMHVPEQAAALPERFQERVRTADHVIHAGDFGSADAYKRVQSMATDLTAVYGNADPNDIDLPAVASVTIGGVAFVVTHGIVDAVERAVARSEGVVMNRDDWLDAIAGVARQRADEPMVGVGGHSHDVEDVVHDGVCLLNPGASTGVGRAEGATMLTADVADGDLTVTVHEA